MAAALAAIPLVTLSAQEGFRFTSGIELVNVTATVTDDRGRFIDALRKDDFTLYENGVRQEISHFSAGKVHRFDMEASENVDGPLENNAYDRPSH